MYTSVQRDVVHWRGSVAAELRVQCSPRRGELHAMAWKCGGSVDHAALP